MNQSYERADAQNNIFRLDVNSIGAIAVDTPIYPSISDFSSNTNISSNTTTQQFADPALLGLFNGLFERSIIYTVWALAPDNDGYWVITEVSPDKNTITVEPLQGQVMVSFAGAGAIPVTSNSLLKKYRAFSFQDDVVVTFNENTALTYDLPAYEPLFLDRSMVSISVNTVTTIMWSR